MRQALDDFVAAYNATAAPFEWKKAVVFPSKLKSKYSELMQVGTKGILRYIKYKKMQKVEKPGQG